jgi:alginate O-acetyltransferase complex protein AlgJ
MLDAASLRYRYTQFFVLFVLCAIIYVMAQSIGPGITTFQNNLYKRIFLIEKVTQLRMKLGDRVFPQVLLGKDGWMEYTNAGNIDDFQNLKQFENKKDLFKKLTILSQYLKSQGITLLIVVAPNKATIYPDRVPSQIKTLPTQSRLDELMTYLKDNDLSVMVDLRPALQAARQNKDVYYKTDTHWNGYGAFVAYKTIINALSGLYPELKPYEVADLELTTKEADLLGMPRMLQLNKITEPTFFFEPKKLFVETLPPNDTNGNIQYSRIPDSKLPTLLVFHDSFGILYLNNYLSMNFGKSTFIRLNRGSEYLTPESIQYFKPDIIVIEIVERNLELFPDSLSSFAPE